MQFRRLGRTGLDLSVLSLGSGGPNQFGQMRYAPKRDICDLVRRALDSGINFFDSANAYSNSEFLLGEALRGVPRDRYYLSSKVYPIHDNEVMKPVEVRRRVEKSLRMLGVDMLDIYCFHKVRPAHYDEAIERLLPTLRALRNEGKIRYIGITESSNHDPQHKMLKQALQDNHFDTIMVSYHMANRSAELEIFPLAKAQDVGVVGMLPARHLVSRNFRERSIVFSRAMRSCLVSKPGPEDLFGRLLVAISDLLRTSRKRPIFFERANGKRRLMLPTAAYTFATSHPAITTVLTGTINSAHLEQNVRAALARPLEPEEIDRLQVILQL